MKIYTVCSVYEDGDGHDAERLLLAKDGQITNEDIRKIGKYAFASLTVEAWEDGEVVSSKKLFHSRDMEIEISEAVTNHERYMVRFLETERVVSVVYADAENAMFVVDGHVWNERKSVVTITITALDAPPRGQINMDLLYSIEHGTTILHIMNGKNSSDCRWGIDSDRYLTGLVEKGYRLSKPIEELNARARTMMQDRRRDYEPFTAVTPEWEEFVNGMNNGTWPTKITKKMEGVV